MFICASSFLLMSRWDNIFFAYHLFLRSLSCFILHYIQNTFIIIIDNCITVYSTIRTWYVRTVRSQSSNTTATAMYFLSVLLLCVSVPCDSFFFSYRNFYAARSCWLLVTRDRWYSLSRSSSTSGHSTRKRKKTRTRVARLNNTFVRKINSIYNNSFVIRHSYEFKNHTFNALYAVYALYCEQVHKY